MKDHGEYINFLIKLQVQLEMRTAVEPRGAEGSPEERYRHPTRGAIGGERDMESGSPTQCIYQGLLGSMGKPSTVLYRLWETPAGEHFIKQLVAPKEIRAELLQQLHSPPTAGEDECERDSTG